ncbi:MAG: hypothetical protein M3P29_04370 [Acidobacteriota bacterium]|nr:hypothetical protein [Acidobacteriota bacterium]
MNRYDRKLQVIYVGILMSTLIYAVIAWAATNAVRAKTLPEELRAPVTIGLYAAAAVAFFVAMITRSRRLLVVRWAMLEVACICGLTASLLHGDWRLYAAPWALVLAGLIALYPRVRMAPR